MKPSFWRNTRYCLAKKKCFHFYFIKQNSMQSTHRFYITFFFLFPSAFTANSEVHCPPSSNKKLGLKMAFSWFFSMIFFFWFASVKVKKINLSAGCVAVEIYFTLKGKGKGGYAEEVESWAAVGEGSAKKVAQGPGWEKRPSLCAGCQRGRACPVIKCQKGSRKQMRK